jgi:methylenetetrahydrofolate--tRNA-(uracil-5-)-methyltransferase
MRGASLGNAVGLLKEELRRAGSLVLRVADATSVPAGGALAVDRERFGAEMTRAIDLAPSDHASSIAEVLAIPDERPVILATGPLTGDALAESLASAGGGQAPGVLRRDRADRQRGVDRLGQGVEAVALGQGRAAERRRSRRRPTGERSADDATEGGDEAYVNCPFSAVEYQGFVKALVEAEKVEARSFEDVRYFEGCLPCEVMAERGEQTLAFGPMKPVGLVDPRTGRRPYAVIQLRPEDAGATAYNLVGFQTRMKYPEQLRVFRMIPGLEEAEFLRMGSVHRNTFVNAPVAALADDGAARGAGGVPGRAGVRGGGLRGERGGRVPLRADAGAEARSARGRAASGDDGASGGSSRTCRGRRPRISPRTSPGHISLLSRATAGG